MDSVVSVQGPAAGTAAVEGALDGALGEGAVADDGEGLAGRVAEETRIRIEQRLQYLCLANDGAAPQIAAQVGRLSNPIQRKGLAVLFAKYSGGASMTQTRPPSTPTGAA